MNIAIDGPSGAGKSSLAKGIAKHYGIVYVDTGALYRTVGLYARRKGFPVEEVGKILPFLSEKQPWQPHRAAQNKLHAAVRLLPCRQWLPVLSDKIPEKARR